MKESIKNTLVGIVCATLIVGDLAFSGCNDNINSQIKIKQQKEYSRKQGMVYTTKPVMSVTRDIEYLGGDVYRVNLKVDVDERKGLSNFAITEFYPRGWEILDADPNAFYNDDFRIHSSIIDWIALEGLNDNWTAPEDFNDSRFLRVKDNVFSYKIKKTNDYNDFAGEWISVHPTRDETFRGSIKNK